MRPHLLCERPRSATSRVRARRPAVLFALLLPLLSGCVGEHLPPLDQGGEPAPRVVGLQSGADQEHKRLLQAFGGEYKAPQLRAVLDGIVQRLAKASDGQIGSYEITILNSPAVNAFALPNGRLYVTRGLLALANDSAEIASVMAHEIAHVTARHAVERAEMELETALVSQVVADVLKDPSAGAALQAGSKLSLARFSRQQELIADQISVANIAQAGYDPYGAVRFLNALGRNTAFRAGKQGGAGDKKLDILSSHPSTPERVAAVTARARQIGAPGIGEREAERWLAALNGLAFGDDPSDGVVRGRRYLNSALRIAFTAPEGFELESARDMVIGVGADGAQALRFDSVALKPGQTLESYVGSGWIDGVVTGEVQSLTVGGFPAAVTSGKGTDWRFRLAAIQSGSRVYRFILAAKGSADPERQMQALLDGFRGLPQAEARSLEPLRIRLVTAGPEDTAATLAARMPGVDRAQEQFLILNGLERGARLTTGQRYKIVSE